MIVFEIAQRGGRVVLFTLRKSFARCFFSTQFQHYDIFLDTTLRMPEITGTFLAELNPHPRDDRIKFQEEGHVYTIDGDDTSYTSVTTLIHKYFPHFDPDRVISKITTNPKSEYFGMEPDAVKKMWTHATELGSRLHEQIEVFFDHLAETHSTVLETCAPSVEFGYFLDFYRDCVVGKMTPYRTEMYVFDEDARVCGAIDMLFCDPNDCSKLYIYDWKRSKKISKSNPFEKGLRCLSFYDNCNFVTYSLQLNMYKYILESKYDKVVVGMALVILHPNHRNYQVIHVPDMQADIHRILESKDSEGEVPCILRGNVAMKYLLK